MWLPLRFADALVRYWGSIVPAGVLIGILGIWQSTGHKVPPSVYWAIAVLGLVPAAYRAWRDEHQQLEEARQKEAELQGKLDARKRWEFEVEFLKASRTVYMYQNGNSPFGSVFVWALVHNRNPNPTTVYVRGVSVQLSSEIDGSFQRATIIPGGRFNFNDPEEYERYDMAGSSSIELLFYTRRYNPPHIEEYVQDAPLSVTLELDETFGNRCKLTGPLALGGVERQ